MISPKFIEAEKIKQNKNAEKLLLLTEQQVKTPEKNKIDINSLTEFKALVIKMLIRERIDIHSKHFNKKLENATWTQS